MIVDQWVKDIFTGRTHKVKGQMPM